MTKTINHILLKIKIAVLLLIERLKQEPVLVRTILSLLIGLGIINLTEANVNQIEQIALVILVLLGSNSARKRVKPLTETELNEAKITKAAKRIERVQEIKKTIKNKTNLRGDK